MNLTEDQILSLAPDDGSKKSGRDLANPAKWVTKGTNEQALWGECKGSGSKPYQTTIDLLNIAFKCSCPSRKFPCKHGIALGLLYARNGKSFAAAEAPAWVMDWISKRVQKEEKKDDKKDKGVDEVAQAKRQQAREQKVNDGIEELLTWIKDIVRNGIINMPDKGYAYWNGIAKRLIDAQAPGLAGMIKNLADISFFKEGWQSDFIDALLSIYLVAKAYQNKENLSPLVMQEVRNGIGFTQKTDDVKDLEGIKDNWLVVGKQTTVDDTITVERNWLYGINTNQYALVLQFLVRGEGASLLLSPGVHLDAELVYFPSITPLRALVKQQTGAIPTAPQQLFSSWKEVSEKETEICSKYPVLTERPFGIRGVTPVTLYNSWWLKDRESNMVPIKESFAGIWKLLALSGGEPLDMVVVGRERRFEPIGVWDHKTYKAI